MVRREGSDGDWRSLCWIDFQDALLGPRVYDLVALLNDSYQTFDRPFVEARLDEYVQAARLGADRRAELGREFDRVTVQRKLKDAGRFVFIDRVKSNAFVPASSSSRPSRRRGQASRDWTTTKTCGCSGQLLTRVLPG